MRPVQARALAPRLPLCLLLVAALGTASLGGPAPAQAAAGRKPIDQAIDLYYRLKYKEALARLERLQAKAKLSDEQRARVLQYQAFALLALERREEARATWLELLALRPFTMLDPDEVPPELVAFFGPLQLPPSDPAAAGDTGSGSAAAGADEDPPSTALGGGSGEAAGATQAGPTPGPGAVSLVTDAPDDTGAPGGPTLLDTPAPEGSSLSLLRASPVAAGQPGAGAPPDAEGARLAQPPASGAELALGITLRLLPFGTGQFYNRQPVKGLLFAALEAGTLAANVSLHYWLLASDLDRQDPAAYNRRITVQNVLLGVFIAATVGGVVDAFVCAP